MVNIPEKLFWRNYEAPRPVEKELWDLVAKAHDRSAHRGNVSSVMVEACAQAAGDYTKAIAGALATLGKKHAPLVQTMALLNAPDPAEEARVLLSNGGTVPGWGNSFHKGVPDPEWREVASFIHKNFPFLSEKIQAVETVLWANGRMIYPNPSTYTAALAIVLGMPDDLAPSLFVTMRLNAWSEIFWRSFSRG
jgi:citrate synthase